jgi:5-methylcytosine-specific restriction endonuclease McrBC regulatory subunit McrC
MSELFEEYIFEFIRRNKERFGISKVESQRGKRLIDGVYEIHENGEEHKIKDTMMNTFTDIVITFEKNGKEITKSLIVDTKYKLLNDDGANHFNIKNTDVYQVMTYKLLHSTENTDVDVALLYPRNKKDHKMRLSVAGKDNVYIYTVNLHKDLRSDNESVFEDLNSFLRALAA